MKKLLLSGLAISTLIISCTKETNNISSNLLTEEEMQEISTRANGQEEWYITIVPGGQEGIGHSCDTDGDIICKDANVEIGCKGELMDIDCGPGLHEILDKINSSSVAEVQDLFLKNTDFLNAFLPDKMVTGVINGNVLAEVFELEETPTGVAYVEYTDALSGDLIMASEITF